MSPLVVAPVSFGIFELSYRTFCWDVMLGSAVSINGFVAKF